MATTSGSGAETRWYRLVDGEQVGPTDLESLRALVLDGVVEATTWVWADEMPSWRPAREVPALVPPPSLRDRVRGW